MWLEIGLEICHETQPRFARHCPDAGRWRFGPAKNDPTAVAILDKALKAAGGEERLAKLTSITSKLKGTSYDDGEKIPFTSVAYQQGPNRYRIATEMRIQDVRTRELTVHNGGQGWIKVDDDETEAMEPDELREQQEHTHFEWVSMTLAPLKSKEYRLSLVEEIQVDGRPAVGFRVSRQGRRDLRLYFDKETYLQVKCERQTKDEDGNEVKEELFLGNYKNIDGVQVAMQSRQRWDGKLVFELELTDVKVDAKLDERLFAKP